MTTKENKIKQLKKEILLVKLKNNRKFLIKIISKTLNINPKYLANHIKLNINQNNNPYDLYTKITNKEIRIETSILNDKIRKLKQKPKYYEKKYNNETKKISIKININNFYNKNTINDELKKIKKNIKTSKNQLLDIDIALNTLILYKIKHETNKNIFVLYC